VPVAARTALVTGGSGYFGALLATHLVDHGYAVRTLDINAPDPGAPVDYVYGDIRDAHAVRAACDGVDVVFHNVAQVPLAKDRDLFESVNVGGTATLLVSARDAGVAKVVATSSSAVFGVPASNPVDEDTAPRPLEPYGRAKLRGELLCRDAAATGLDVSVIRPRTILGHGRLGIIALLFDWVAEGAAVPVLGHGDNRYQLVHADDLAAACRLAGERPDPSTYNIGATEFGTMRESLESLIAHAGTRARVRSVPVAPAVLAMKALARLGLAPFAPYHWLLYGESMWFDTSRARDELGWEPAHSNASMLAESYDWFLAHRDSPRQGGASHHQSPVREGALRVMKLLR
jgi:nucleoside-diphosphate-sugar epimerase